MKDYQVDLVKSTYSVHDAKEVLLSLLSDKIKFLNCKIFSLEERFGDVPAHLRERVEELKREKDGLIEMLDSFDDENHLVETSCQIVLKVKEGASSDASLYRNASSSVSR